MCYPVFKKTKDGYTLVAVYHDLGNLEEDWEVFFDDSHHWEPWPLDKPFVFD